MQLFSSNQPISQLPTSDQAVLNKIKKNFQVRDLDCLNNLTNMGKMWVLNQYFQKIQQKKTAVNIQNPDRVLFFFDTKIAGELMNQTDYYAIAMLKGAFRVRNLHILDNISRDTKLFVMNWFANDGLVFE